MRSCLLVTLTLVVGACGQEADPASVRERIARDVPPLVDESAAAGDGAAPTFGAMSSGFDALDRLAPGILPGFLSDASGGGGLKRLAALPALPALGDEGETGADVARDVNDTLFTD